MNPRPTARKPGGPVLIQTLNPRPTARKPGGPVLIQTLNPRPTARIVGGLFEGVGELEIDSCVVVDALGGIEVKLVGWDGALVLATDK